MPSNTLPVQGREFMDGLGHHTTWTSSSNSSPSSSRWVLSHTPLLRTTGQHHGLYSTVAFSKVNLSNVRNKCVCMCVCVYVCVCVRACVCVCVCVRARTHVCQSGGVCMQMFGCVVVI